MNLYYNREMIMEAIGEGIIEAMKAGDGRTRCFGAKALGRLKVNIAVHTLIEYLDDEDPDVRCDAAAVLGELSDPQAVPALIQSMDDGDGAVRICAIQALGKIGSPVAVEPLIHAMVSPGSFPYMLGELSGDYRWEIREKAAESLGKLRDPRSVIALTEFLSDEDADLMLETVFRSLIQSGDPGGKEAVALYLKDPDPRIRRKAVRAFSHSGDEEMPDYLRDLLADGDSVVRGSVIESIGNTGSEKDIIPLILLLKDEDSDVRIKAAEAIYKINKEKAIKHLFVLLHDPVSDVRKKIIGLLGETGSGECVEALIHLLAEKDDGVCGEAILALGRIGNDMAAPSLKALVKGRRSEVLRSRALFALGKIGGLEGLEIVSDILIDKGEDKEIKRMALQVLPMFDQEAILNRVGKILNTGADDLVRRGVARIFRNFEDHESDKTLLFFLRSDENEDVRREAALSLAYRGNDAGMDTLNSLIDSCLSSAGEGGLKIIGDVCDAIREIRTEQAVNLLLKCASSQNPAFRCFAVRAIGKTGNRAMIDTVEDLLTDDDKDVRREAVIALGRLGDRKSIVPLISSLSDLERFNDLRNEIAIACKGIDMEMTTELLLDFLMDTEKKEYHWVAIETLVMIYGDS